VAGLRALQCGEHRPERGREQQQGRGEQREQQPWRQRLGRRRAPGFHPQGPNGGPGGKWGGQGRGGNIWWQQHQAHVHMQGTTKQGTAFVHIRQSPDPISGSPSRA